MLAYGEELELIKDNVKVCWANIGEGYEGDYDEDDPEDENLLRYDVYVYDTYNEDCEEGYWRAIDDASYCTYVSADTDNETLMKLLNVLMRNFYDVLHDDINASVKKLAERMSWIN